jgi:hypothetical protein
MLHFLICLSRNLSGYAYFLLGHILVLVFRQHVKILGISLRSSGNFVKLLLKAGAVFKICHTDPFTHQYDGLSSWLLPITNIKNVPSILTSDVSDIFCL